MRGVALALAAAALVATVNASAVRVNARAHDEPVAGETYRAPKAPDGTGMDKVKLTPMQGEGDKPVEVAAWTTVGGNLPSTARYGNLHSYTEDLKSLVREMDDSEEEARTLRVKLVEKDNFLEMMLKRERILKIDMEQHKTQLAAMNAHIQAIEARVERLKKERQQAELDYQKSSMDSATRHLATTISSVEAVSSALDARLGRTDERVKDSMMRETEAMRRSLQPDVAAGDARDEAALQAVAASVANVPPTGGFFLQRGALRGSQ